MNLIEQILKFKTQFSKTFDTSIKKNETHITFSDIATDYTEKIIDFLKRKQKVISWVYWVV